MIIVLSSSLLRLQSCYSNVVATPLCTTLEFSDRALAHWSPNSLLFRPIVKPPQLPTHRFGRKT